LFLIADWVASEAKRIRKENLSAVAGNILESSDSIVCRAMYLYMISVRAIAINRFLSGIFAVTVVCVLLSTSGVGLCANPNGRLDSLGSKSVAIGNEAAIDSNGPTLELGYSKKGFKNNPISSFMYFVPLISTTLVDREISANNEQKVDIITYEKKVTSKSFNVVCEFEILGKGFHKNTFDAEGMIAAETDDLGKGELLKNILDYIKIEGEGLGRIEVKGTMTSSPPSVTELCIQFNVRGHKSPVTIGLYDIKSKTGQYKYENRSNQIVARVNSLIFKKTEKIPRMGIKVASITGQSESDSFFSTIKGAIANLFISPPKVTKLGNEIMLDFGHALLEQKSAFTFPKVKNIKENRMVLIVDSAKK